MVMSFHILQQEPPKEEKVGVKERTLLSCSTTPVLQTVPIQTAQLALSLVFLRPAPLPNAVLCHDFLFDYSSKAAVHQRPSRPVC